jgi:metal-sulfur cluster biosynthetic enzyme
VLTPTYSGCPATEVIEQSVCEALDAPASARRT